MRLTRLQRHTAYIILLDYIESTERICGLCTITQELFGWNDDNNCTSGVYNWALYNLDYLPELRSKKPQDAFGLNWFRLSPEGMLQRAALLKECIEETA